MEQVEYLLDRKPVLTSPPMVPTAEDEQRAEMFLNLIVWWAAMMATPTRPPRDDSFDTVMCTVCYCSLLHANWEYHWRWHLARGDIENAGETMRGPVG